MTSALSPVSLTSYFAPEDGSVRQAKLYFYNAGTLDPIAVWTDSGLTIPHSQPVLTGGSGRVPPVFVGEIAPYRVRTFDSFDVLIEDIDNIPGAPPSSLPAPPVDVDPLRLIPTGAIQDFWETGSPKAGWARCNGGTIGPPGSGASENASASAEDLFKYLWQDPNTVIQPARGASSNGDWTDITTPKKLVLPDLRNRARFTIDGFGVTPPSGRLTGAHFVQYDRMTLGGNGGEPTHSLSVAELAAHNHTLTIDPHNHANAKAAVHAHTFSGNTGTESANHVHSGTTNAENANHQHSYTPPIAAGTVNSGVAFGVAAVGSTTTTGSDNANHSHTFSTGAESAAHSHAFSGTTANNPTQQVVTMDPTTVTATIASAGNGDAFSLVPPFIIVSTYIKL
jgi:hypothetical protein